MGGCFVDGAATLQCLPTLFINVVFAFLVLAGTTALFFLAWGSIALIRSGGDPKKISGGQQTMTYAIIGLIIVLTSFAVVYLIGYITGTTDCITNPEKLFIGC